MKPLTKEDFHTFSDDDGCNTISCKEHLMKQILKDQEMIKRLMESGYVLSKFGKDKTYSQTEMMYVFQGIIEGDK